MILLYKVDRKFDALESLINSKTNIILKAIKVSPYNDYADVHNQENIHEQTTKVSIFFLQKYMIQLLTNTLLSQTCHLIRYKSILNKYYKLDLTTYR